MSNRVEGLRGTMVPLWNLYVGTHSRRVLKSWKEQGFWVKSQLSPAIAGRRWSIMYRDWNRTQTNWAWGTKELTINSETYLRCIAAISQDSIYQQSPKFHWWTIPMFSWQISQSLLSYLLMISWVEPMSKWTNQPICVVFYSRTFRRVESQFCFLNPDG